jgi:hypothetical protein
MRNAAKGGVPDQMPSNLTSKFALRQAMNASLANAINLANRVGVQDISGGSAGSQPVYSAMDVTKKVRNSTMGNPKMGINNAY